MYTTPAEPKHAVPERVVQGIWFGRHLLHDRLRTVSGKTVVVHDPGRWNGEAGPDFRSADLEIGGVRLRGDVEIHIDAADWERHGHHRDFDYNSVILHVVLDATDAGRTDELHNGGRVERLALRPYLSEPLEVLEAKLAGQAAEVSTGDDAHPDGPPCRRFIARLEGLELHEILDAAARARVEAKIGRFASQAAREPMDQVLYQAIMTSMGTKGGKTLFFLLSKRAPLADLATCLHGVPDAERPLALEAILLHTAGLVGAASARAAATGTSDLFTEADQVNGKVEPDEETAAYLAALGRHWQSHGMYFADRLIPPTRRWFAGIRPANFPPRRLAGIARLLASGTGRGSLLQWLTQALENALQSDPRTAREFKRTIQELATLLMAPPEGYWARRFTLGGKQAATPMLLIGEDRAYSTLYNAVLPVLILHTRQRNLPAVEAFAWRLLNNFPALSDNTVTRHMRERLFAGVANLPPGLNFRMEKQAQALMHIYQQCCSNRDLTCENCYFRTAITP